MNYVCFSKILRSVEADGETKKNSYEEFSTYFTHICKIPWMYFTMYAKLLIASWTLIEIYLLKWKLIWIYFSIIFHHKIILSLAIQQKLPQHCKSIILKKKKSHLHLSLNCLCYSLVIILANIGTGDFTDIYLASLNTILDKFWHLNF